MVWADTVVCPYGDTSCCQAVRAARAVRLDIEELEPVLDVEADRVTDDQQHRDAQHRTHDQHAALGQAIERFAVIE